MQVALGADEVPAAKPAAEGLLLCCERLSVDPASSVYVGDSPTDGQAASPSPSPSPSPSASPSPHPKPMARRRNPDPDPGPDPEPNQALGQAARAAGMKSIGVLWGAGEEAALGASFDVVVPDVPELIVALRDTFAAVAEDAH